MSESILIALTFDYSLFLLVRCSTLVRRPLICSLQQGFQEELAIGMSHQAAVIASRRSKSLLETVAQGLGPL